MVRIILFFTSFFSLSLAFADDIFTVEEFFSTLETCSDYEYQKLNPSPKLNVNYFVIIKDLKVLGTKKISKTGKSINFTYRNTKIVECDNIPLETKYSQFHSRNSELEFEKNDNGYIGPEFLGDDTEFASFSRLILKNNELEDIETVCVWNLDSEPTNLCPNMNFKSRQSYLKRLKKWKKSLK